MKKPEEEVEELILRSNKESEKHPVVSFTVYEWRKILTQLRRPTLRLEAEREVIEAVRKYSDWPSVEFHAKISKAMNDLDSLGGGK